MNEIDAINQNKRNVYTQIESLKGNIEDIKDRKDEESKVLVNLLRAQILLSQIFIDFCDMRLDSMFDLDTYNKLVNMWKKAEMSILDMSYTINGDSGIMKYTNKL